MISNVLAIAGDKLVIRQERWVDVFFHMLRRFWAGAMDVGGFPWAFLIESLAKSS